MKVIFLDFDGVLNSENFIHEIGDEAFRKENEIDKKAIIRLNKIIEETDAIVVISSSWRIYYPLCELIKILESNGFIGKVIDVTSNLNTLDRGDEIWDWFDRRAKALDVTNYVIIDDDRLFAGHNMDDPILDMHFVRTSWLDGLQDKHVNKAIEILKNDSLS